VIGSQVPVGLPPVIEPSVNTIPIIEIPSIPESQIASGADSSPYPATPPVIRGSMLDRNENIKIAEN
jgi:hypothetical protein